MKRAKPKLKSARLNIPCTEEQLEAWKVLAAGAKRSLADWTRLTLDEKRESSS